MDTYFLVLCAVGFVASYIIFLFGRPIAKKSGLVDRPGGRKTHEGVIPVIGGLVIITVFSVLIILSGITGNTYLKPLLGAVFAVLLMGFIDDRYQLKPWFRFVLQIFIACYVVIFCGAELTQLGNLFGLGTVWLGSFSKIFSAVCFVLLMNAMNMLDGMDGLAGGYIAIAMGWLLWVAHESGATEMAHAIIFLLIPLSVFLIFNARYPGHKRASVFLGDAGSLSLALIFGWFAIHSVISSELNPYIMHQTMPPVFIIWLMSVPIIETFSIFFTRMKQGRSPFEADRLHLHYILKDSGWPPILITPFILSIAFITGGIGYYGAKAGVPDFILLYTWTALLLGVTYFRREKFAK
ncbi:MAG: MraY family glycosyltransferase [Pseudomonadota bacterium]